MACVRMLSVAQGGTLKTAILTLQLQLVQASVATGKL